MKIDKTVSIESISKEVLEQLQTAPTSGVTGNVQLVDSGGTALPLIASIEDVELSVDELKATQTDGTQKTQIVDPATHPTILDIADQLDTTDGSVIYRGYKRGASYLVAKQVISGSLVSTTWATGAWADRATLTYA